MKTHPWVRLVRLFPTEVMAFQGGGRSPALTVTALTNCSLQLLLPTTSARLVFLINLSTVLCRQERAVKPQPLQVQF